MSCILPQNTGEIWSSNRSWNPGEQADVCQHEYQQCGEWSWAEGYPPFPYQSEPHPTATQLSTWQMGCPDHQSHPDFQGYEPSQPTCQANYPNHYPLSQNEIYRPWSHGAGDQFPTWSNEDWPTQDPQYYQNQACPDQHQYQPQPQQGFEIPLDENHYAEFTEERIEGLIVSQQSMRRCMKSNDELTLEVRHTYDEQKSSMDEMIKQVALLTDIMKGIQEDRARSEVNEKRIEEEGVSEPEEMEPSDAEQNSEAPLEKQEKVGATEAESAEEEFLAEEEPITTPRNKEMSQKILEKANDEPQVKEERGIKHNVEFRNTLFYLQEKMVHVLDRKVERFVAAMEGENAPAERPPPVIDKPDAYYEEARPRLKE